MLHDCFAGFSYNSLASSFADDFKRDPSTFYGWITVLVLFIYDVVDRNLKDGMLFGEELKLSAILETDEKEIPTSPDTDLPAYRKILKRGHPVYKLLISGLVERGDSGFSLVEDLAGTGSVEDLVRVWSKGRERFGPGVLTVYYDRHRAHAEACKRVFGPGVGIPLSHMGRRRLSPVHRMEGIHKGMDDKLQQGIRSKKGIAALRGHWLHYNFARRFQSNRDPRHKGWTRFEIAIGHRIAGYGNGWILLLSKALEWLEGQEGYELRVEATTDDPWVCLKDLVTRRHSRVFKEYDDGRVYCAVCVRFLTAQETRANHIHDNRLADGGYQAEISEVKETARSRLSGDLASLGPTDDPDLPVITERIAKINDNPDLAVFSHCPGLELGCPYVALVFKDPVLAKGYLGALKRGVWREKEVTGFRVHVAGLGGMAAFASNFPLARGALLFIARPYTRALLTREAVRLFWKDAEALLTPVKTQAPGP